MKRLIALITAICLISSPALAGITPLSGTTNGLLASGNSAGTTTISTGATTVDAPIGTMLVLSVSYRSTGAISCTDSLGTHNTYNSPLGQTTFSTSVKMFYSVVTQDNPIGTTYSCSAATSAQFGVVVSAWSGAAASPYDTGVTAGSSTASLGGTVGPTSTLACNSSAGELATAIEASVSSTFSSQPGGWSDYGVALSDSSHPAFQILNSNAAISYSPTYTGTTSAWQGQIMTFKAASCVSSAPHGLLLTGVGQ